MHVQHQIRTVHFARMPTQVRFHNVKAVLDWRSFWCVRGPRRHAVPGVEQQRTNGLQPEGNAKAANVNPGRRARNAPRVCGKKRCPNKTRAAPRQ